MNPHLLMNSLGRLLPVSLAAAALIVATPHASAGTSGRTSQGWAFVEGGVGQTEADSMESDRGKYSLWVMTAHRGSGAHLADADVSIYNDKGEEVFERRLDGPWLMIDLPLGRYEVRARYSQEAQSRITTIHPGDHHQVIFYFNAQAEVLPKP